MKIFSFFAAILLLAISSAFCETIDAKRNPILAKMESSDTPERYKLAFDFLAQADSDTPGTDLAAVYLFAMQSLRNEQRWSEYDELLSQAARYPASLELLIAMGEEPLHYGRMIDGKFVRGNRRGSGPMIDCAEYDRAANIRRLAQALPVVEQAAPELRGKFYRALAKALMRNRTTGQRWRLFESTRLDALRAIDAPQGEWKPGMPVDAKGNVMFFDCPADFASAKNDGERIRWALAQGAAAGDIEAKLDWVNFVDTLFPFLPPPQPFEEITEYQRQLSSIPDDEAWVELATGRKRIRLPEAYRILTLCEALQKEAPSNKQVAARLAQENLIRCRYPAALRNFKLANTNSSWQKILEKPNAILQPTPIYPAGREPEVTLQYRNAKRATLTLNRLNPEALNALCLRYLTTPTPDKAPAIPSPFDSATGFLKLPEFQSIIGTQLKQWEIKLESGKEHFIHTRKLPLPLTEEGLYLLTIQLPEGNKTLALIQLSTIAIAEQQTIDGTQFIITDSRSGAPMPNAKVTRIDINTEFANTPAKVKEFGGRTRVTAITAQGTTAKDGCVILKSGEKNYGSSLVFVENATSGTWLTYWNNRAYPQKASAQPRAFVISNAPVYKPSQTAFFSALIRRSGYGEIFNPMLKAGTRFAITIRSPRGTEVLKQEYALSDSGTIAFEYPIPEAPELGVWQVTIMHGKQWIGNGSFRVEEFRKPEFKVDVAVPEKPVEPGSTIRADIRAAYYFGAPVVGGKVTYRVWRERTSMPFPRPAPWSWLYGKDYASCTSVNLVHWGPPRPRERELVMQGNGVTDAQGLFRLDISAEKDENTADPTDLRYSIEAEVTDSSEQEITGNGSIIVAQRPLRLSIWADGGFFKAGTPFSLRIAAHLPDGKPFAGTGTIQLYRTQLEHGQIVRAESVGQPLQRQTTLTNEAAALPLTLNQPGVYEIVATMTAPNGRTVSTSTQIRIQGHDSAAGLYSAYPLEITCDKAEYKPGDRAKLLFSSAHKRGTLFVFTRAERFSGKFQMLPLENHSTELELTLDEQDRPNTFVAAFLIADGTFVQAHKALVLPPEQKHLQVTVASAKSTLQPGEQDTVTIRVTDAANRPANGIVTIAVYDEALEYLAGNRLIPDINQHFWGWKRYWSRHFISNLGTVFFDTAQTGEWPEFPIELLQRNGYAQPGMFKGKFAIAESAVANADTAGGLASVPLRSDFRDSLFWAAQRKLNADGTLTLPLTMPDNLTTWKIKVWAITDQAAVGTGEATVMVSKKLIAQLVAPRFLVAGDHGEAFAVFHNNTCDPLKLQAQFQCAGAVASAAEDKAELSIEPGRAQRLTWKFTAAAAGEGTFSLRAKSGELQDGMTLSIPVLERGSEQRITRSAVVNGSTDTLTWEIPAAIREKSAALNIRLTPSIARSVLELLPYLAGDETRNTFSLPSRWIPALAARNAMLTLGVSAQQLGKLKFDTAEVEQLRKHMYVPYSPVPLADDATLRKRAESSLAMLQAMQNSDGGWGWFSGTREQSYPDTSCYVLQHLLSAKRAGIAVPPEMLKRGLNWLQTYQQKALLAKSCSNINAWAFEILSAAGHFDRAMGAALMQCRRESLTPYGLSLLGLGMYHARQTTECKILLGDLAQYIRRKPENQSVYLECPEAYRYVWYGSDSETQAAYLRFLALADPQNPNMAPLAKYLTSNLLYAPWRNSTRTLATGVEALIAYLEASRESKPDYRYRILWDGKELHAGTVSAATLFDAIPELSVPASLLTGGSHKLEIQHRGTGALYLSGTLRYFNRSQTIAPAGNELKVNRSYWLLAPRVTTTPTLSPAGHPDTADALTWQRTKLTDATSLRPGDTVEVELNIDGSNDFDYIVVRDPLPAGLASATIRSGYLSWYLPVYAQYRTTASEFYIRSLGRDNNQIRYRLQVAFPGVYLALPATARGVYAPELHGNSGTQQFRIGEALP